MRLTRGSALTTAVLARSLGALAFSNEGFMNELVAPEVRDIDTVVRRDLNGAFTSTLKREIARPSNFFTREYPSRRSILNELLREDAQMRGGW
ncbi:hypothetical protein BKA70DRAFT_1299221 [Coprinopsis sp. MPI-PUGE-AT-0042]|nr:hypothetical protein BKA70DRAFT_1299221 [Coprinopsis sp. MPI-PUGE-AT-0042]